MGFGLLFSGYFFLLFFPISTTGILPNFAAIGGLLMLAALKRLIHYCPDCKSFNVALYPVIAYTAVSVAIFVFGMLGFSAEGASAASRLAYNIAELAAQVSVLIGSVCMFLGIHKLSVSVELPKLASRSVRMISFTAAYGVLSVTAAVTDFIHGSVTNDTAIIAFNYINLAAFLFMYVFIFLCLAYFFTCYMRICLEGDEDMPYREDVFDKIVAWFKRNKKQ